MSSRIQIINPNEYNILDEFESNNWEQHVINRCVEHYYDTRLTNTIDYTIDHSISIKQTLKTSLLYDVIIRVSYTTKYGVGSGYQTYRIVRS